jgi:glycosyltransferase involved in cell wall biosynthesis
MGLKIANIQLNPDEDESIHQKGHCGGTCFSRYAKEILNNGDRGDEFFIYGQESNFKNLKNNERMDRCVALPRDRLDMIRSGSPIREIIPESEGWDIIVHNQESWAANTCGIKAKQVCWFTFVNQTVHPNCDALLLYSGDQKPRCHKQINAYKIVIGKDIPDFSRIANIAKEDYVFVCTRHDLSMDTNFVIDICNRYKIKIIVAGPVLGGYDLHINNVNSFYIGKISEEAKIDLTSRASLYSCIQSWDTIFSLSAIESMGVGTPIIARNRGCFSYLVKDGVNGFYFDGSDDSFLRAWKSAKGIDRKSCWSSALPYSKEEMVNSFYRAFLNICL